MSGGEFSIERPNAGPRFSRLIDLRTLGARHSAMLINAAALSGGAGVTAALGFVFWWFAARNFDASALGYAAAAISMMNFLALVGELGMGTLLMGEVPKLPQTAPALISATLMATLVSMVAVGFGYLAIVDWTSINLGGITDGPVARAMFIAGLALTGFTLVLDQAFVGLLQSKLQMMRTTSFAAIKLLLLVAVSGSVQAGGASGIFGTWITGQLCSIALLIGLCVFQRRRFWYVPRVSLLKPLIGTVLRHHLLGVAIQAPGLILPFVVTVILSPQVNASFYASWTLINVVLLVPASLTAVMYSISAREPVQLQYRLKMSLVISIAVGLISAIGLYVTADRVLSLFNSDYRSIAGSSLQILGFGTVAVGIKYHYVAIQRLRYRMVEASLLVGAGGALELLAAIIGARRGGLLGLTTGWLLAAGIEALVLSPVIWRVLCHGLPQPVAQNGPPMVAPSGNKSQEDQPELLCELI